MAHEYFELEPVPYAEAAEQAGTADYYEKGKKQAEAFVKQLRRQFGETPTNKFRTKFADHDCGGYWMVTISYDDEDEASEEFMLKVESECPNYWDEEAKKELEI